NVRFLPRVPRTEISQIMAASDALVMHLAKEPHLEFTIPSKTQFYLARGQAILAGVSGEAAEILRQSGAAIVVSPEDVEAMATAMADMAGRPAEDLRAFSSNGREYYARNLDFDLGIKATLEAIDAATRVPV